MKIKKKFLYLLSINLLIILSFVGLIIFPLQAKLKSIHQDAITIKQNIAKHDEESARLISQYKMIHQIDKDELSNIILKRDETLFLVDSLEKIASNNNCKIDLNLSEPVDNSFTELTIQLMITGKLSNVINFLTEIEKSDFYFNYNSIAISSQTTPTLLQPENSTNSGEVSVNIDLNSFWQ